MTPSLSQIHVLSTLTMLSFALEAREECTDHENSWFLQQRQAQDRRAAQWLSLLV